VRRAVTVAVCVGLLAAGCSSDSKGSSSSTTTFRQRTTSTTSTSLSTTSSVPFGVVRTSTDCPGIGAVPDGVQITWVKDGRLWSADEDGTNRRCLLEAGVTEMQWGGAADRVLLDDIAVVGDRVIDVGERRRNTLGFSRPTGKVVLARDDEGALFKLSVEGAPPVKLDTFANIDSEQGSDVAYHPSGTAIVAAMPRGARPGLLMATNLGEDPRWLVDNETADRIYDVGFTATGAVVFVAHHGDHAHLHELDLTTNALSTVFESPDDEEIKGVATSPWRDGDIAVARAVGADPTQVGAIWVERDGKVVDLTGTAVERSDPVAWLPDGSLLVERFQGNADCCDKPGGDLYLVKGTTAHLIEHNVQRAAVRAVLPPPPPPPPRIDQAAPA
jgi:hypothetical protein